MTQLPDELGATAVLIVALSLFASVSANAESPVTWPQVQELLADRCTLCHSGEDAPLGLRLDTLEGALKGSDNGPVLVAGSPDESELVRRVRGQSEPRMPLTGPPFLNAEEITLLEQWIATGAPAGEEAAIVPEPRPAPRPGPGEIATYSDVKTIFLKHCLKCHKDNGKLGAPPEGLKLGGYDDIVAGGERLVLLPGNPGLSEIVRRVEGKAKPRMPFDGPPWLDESSIALLRDWITQGARNANGTPAAVPEGRELRFRGVMTGRWSIDGAAFVVDGRTRIDKSPRVGDRIEVRGRVDEAGRLRAYRVRRR